MKPYFSLWFTGQMFLLLDANFKSYQGMIVVWTYSL